MAPTFSLAPLLSAWLAAASGCTAVPLFESGRPTSMVRAESPPADVVVLNLSDDWAPALFSESPELPQPYRPTFLALANQRPGTGRAWDIARQDRHYELFGIFPGLAVIAARLADERRHDCHTAVDDGPLAAGRTSMFAGALQAAAIASIHQHLACEGLLATARGEAADTTLDRRALGLYQRLHMIPAGGRFDKETRATLVTDSRELDFRALLRARRERVADATGLIEDGSAANAWEPVLGRHLESAEYRAVLRPKPLERGAPDLIARATEAAAVALGWTSPAAADRSLRAGMPARVAYRHHPPAYHGPRMQLRAEIDRGDVWTEYPRDENGHPLPSPVRRRPTLVLYAVTSEGDVPLVRWATTVGGWQPQRLADGSEKLAYKPSPTGRRYWRDLLAAPAWFPPPTTPDRELVRRGAHGRWTADQAAVGPGYRSAYGLMALLHHRAVDMDATEGGGTRFADIDIRTHGSGNYRSILRGSSHGCHRLFNHLAIRLGSFLLRHHDHLRHGAIEQAYVRRLRWKGQPLVLRAQTRGYRYELVPPLPVDVLPGRVVRSRRPPRPDVVTTTTARYLEEP